MRYVVATDVGGTCTDTVIIAKNKDVIVGKVLSTPPDFERGVIDSVSSAAEAMDMSLEQLLAETFMFIHGSTIALRDLRVTGRRTPASILAKGRAVT